MSPVRIVQSYTCGTRKDPARNAVFGHGTVRRAKRDDSRVSIEENRLDSIRKWIRWTDPELQLEITQMRPNSAGLIREFV